MPEPLLPPVCQAPTCRDAATQSFMRVTKLCARHGAKANRRAATNVVFVGVGFALVGATLPFFGRGSALLAVSGVVGGGGVVVACSTFWYRRAAARLEGLRSSRDRV